MATLPRGVGQANPRRMEAGWLSCENKFPPLLGFLSLPRSSHGRLAPPLPAPLGFPPAPTRPPPRAQLPPRGRGVRFGRRVVGSGPVWSGLVWPAVVWSRASNGDSRGRVVAVLGERRVVPPRAALLLLPQLMGSGRLPSSVSPCSVESAPEH